MPITPTSKFTVSTFADLAKSVCLGPSSWKKHWGSDDELMEELEGRPEWCLDLTFMYGLLRLGYEFDDDREIKLGNNIDGVGLGWTLGAALAMITGAESTCRV